MNQNIQQNTTITNEEKTATGAFFNLILTSGKKAFELAVGELLYILNIFFKGVLGEMQGMTVGQKDARTEYERSVSLLNAIRVVMQDPAFQAEIIKLTGLVETALKPALHMISNIISKEGEVLGKSAYKLTNTITRNIVEGLEDGLDGAVGAVPGLGPIWEAIKIITLVIQSGSEISIGFLTAFTTLANAYVQVIEEISTPVADVLKSAIRMFDLIKNARQNVIDATENATKYVDSIQPTIQKPLQQSLENTIQKPLQQSLENTIQKPLQQSLENTIQKPLQNVNTNLKGGKKLKVH